MRHLLIEREGGHFSFLRKEVGGNIVFLSDKIFCSKEIENVILPFGEKKHFNFVISIPNDIFKKRKKIGVSGYSNIIKSCAGVFFNKDVGTRKSLLLSSKLRIFSSKLNTTSTFVSFTIIENGHFKSAHLDSLKSEDFFFFRNFIISCINSPNPNIAKYIK